MTGKVNATLVYLFGSRRDIAMFIACCLVQCHTGYPLCPSSFSPF